MLAHELRNPLAPIRNAAQILDRKGPKIPELQWARDVIARQVDQLTRLVDDLLDVSRITRGVIELRKQRVELRDVVNSAVEASAPWIANARHTLSVDMPAEPIPLDADPTRLAQILLNLLNNAAKYTEPGGDIRLDVVRKDNDVIIRVRDNGVGIRADMLPRIFDMFAQAGRIHRAGAGRAGHRSHAGETTRVNARRDGRSDQRWPRERERVCRAVADRCRSRRRGARTGSSRPGAGHAASHPGGR